MRSPRISKQSSTELGDLRCPGNVWYRIREIKENQGKLRPRGRSFGNNQVLRQPEGLVFYDISHTDTGSSYRARRGGQRDFVANWHH